MIRFFRNLVALSLLLVVVTSIDYSAPRAQAVTTSVDLAWAGLTLPFKIARLNAQPPDTVLFMPVDGVRVAQVADTWAAPRSGGRSHEGQDIFAPKGTPVCSATRGFITHVSEGGLGGKKVFVLGAGGQSYYYAHLDGWADIREGQAVTPETVLGYVGNTGNAGTTPPHLHFGVYAAGRALNPLPLLTDRVGAG